MHHGPALAGTAPFLHFLTSGRGGSGRQVLASGARGVGRTEAFWAAPYSGRIVTGGYPRCWRVCLPTAISFLICNFLEFSWSGVCWAVPLSAGPPHLR